MTPLSRTNPLSLGLIRLAACIIGGLACTLVTARWALVLPTRVNQPPARSMTHEPDARARIVQPVAIDPSVFDAAFAPRRLAPAPLSAPRTLQPAIRLIAIISRPGPNGAEHIAVLGHPGPGSLLFAAEGDRCEGMTLKAISETAVTLNDAQAEVLLTLCPEAEP